MIKKIEIILKNSDTSNGQVTLEVIENLADE